MQKGERKAPFIEDVTLGDRLDFKNETLGAARSSKYPLSV